MRTHKRMATETEFNDMKGGRKKYCIRGYDGRIWVGDTLILIQENTEDRLNCKINFIEKLHNSTMIIQVEVLD